MSDINKKNNSDELNVSNAKLQGTPATVAITAISVLAAVIVGREIDAISNALVRKIGD